MVPNSIKNLYICTPSAPYNPDFLEKSLEKLRKIGFNPTLSQHAMNNAGNTSASIADRVADLHEGFMNPNYDLVMSSRGGWNSNELLPYVDYELIKVHAKPFIGFSDPTTLDVNLYQKSGIQTYYGSVLSWIYYDPDDADYSQMIEVLNNPQAFTGFYRKPIQKEQIYRHGSMSGKVIGGCITILSAMLGTPFALEIPENGALFLEDDDEPTGYLWQQKLMQMKQAGYFERISGLVIGKTLPTTKFVKGSELRDILDTVIGEYTFPVLLDADFGHSVNPLAIPYGVDYSLSL